MSLADEMVTMAQQHKRRQDRERRAAGDLWEEHGLVWCQPNGKPIDARADWEDWKDVLREAGVRDARVHDGRHTAATMLLLLGINEQTVMAIMGWSDRRMLRRYQHVIDELRVTASRGLSSLLWDAPKKPKKAKVKKAKKVKQGKEKVIDASLSGYATDLATDRPSAKIIRFPRSA